MPTYEYECQKCGKVFENFQSMSSDPLKVCNDPECGGEVKRLLSAGSGLIFKGSGFYITDYKTKSGSASDRSSTGSDGGSSSKSASSESKPSTTESSASKTESSSTKPSSSSGSTS